MSWSDIKALYVAGMQTWFCDKKSIVLRLVVWPNLMPLILMTLMGVSIFVMSQRNASEGGDMSLQGGITFSVFGGTLNKEIGLALQNSTVITDSGPSIRFVHTDVTSFDKIKELISTKKITFALYYHEHSNGAIDMEISYDCSRDYVHTNWIAQVKESVHNITLEIRKKRFADSDIPTKTLNYNLGKVTIKESAYGESSAGMMFNIIVFAFWGILLVTPLACTESISSHLMLSDSKSDFLSTWKAANTSNYSVVIARALVVFSVFLIALTLLFAYLTMWLSLYSAFVDFLKIKAVNAITLNESFRNATVGFVEFIHNISFFDILIIVTMIASMGMLLIALRLTLSLYIVDQENIRTKSVPVELVMSNLPFIAFVSGTLALNAKIALIPGINLLAVVQNVFKGNIDQPIILLAFVSNLVVAGFLLARTAKHIDSEKRIHVLTR